MNKLFFITLTIFLVSCGVETESDLSTNNEETEKSDSVDTENVDSLAVEEGVTKVEFFEDYGQFKTKSDLYEAYDEANLEDGETWYAEGTMRYAITTLTEPETGYLIRFVWDEEDEEQLSFIETWYLTWWEDEPKEQNIKTKEGLYTGMPIDELVKWNSDDIEFAGFGWDYGGSIFGGGESGRIMESKIGVTLDLRDEGYESHPQLVGDANHSTSDKSVDGAPIVIGTISYSPN